MKKIIVSLGFALIVAVAGVGSSHAEATNAPAAGAGKALKPYTLKTCIVSDEKLGEMGDPVVLDYEGREIKFCCKDCVAKFKKNPTKYLKLIDAAEKKAAK